MQIRERDQPEIEVHSKKGAGPGTKCKTTTSTTLSASSSAMATFCIRSDAAQGLAVGHVAPGVTWVCQVTLRGMRTSCGADGGRRDVVLALAPPT